jgi:hypothetical protein
VPLRHLRIESDEPAALPSLLFRPAETRPGRGRGEEGDGDPAAR